MQFTRTENVCFKWIQYQAFHFSHSLSFLFSIIPNICFLIYFLLFQGALCDCHFNFLIAKVGYRMRSSIVTLIYKKTLSVNAATLNSQFSIGEIVNFMSTDTDRIVNSCPSFHSLWSIPFQVRVL